MVHVHTPKGNDETDSGAGAGAGLESEATGKPLCTCNLSPETQDLLKQVFKDIVSVSTLQCVGMLYRYLGRIWHSIISCVLI